MAEDQGLIARTGLAGDRWPGPDKWFPPEVLPHVGSVAMLVEDCEWQFETFAWSARTWPTGHAVDWVDSIYSSTSFLGRLALRTWLEPDLAAGSFDGDLVAEHLLEFLQGLGFEGAKAWRLVESADRSGAMHSLTVPTATAQFVRGLQRVTAASTRLTKPVGALD